MKTILVSIVSGLVLFVTQNFAEATTASVSNIVNPTVICYHVSKSEALVIRTTKPQRVWKTLINRQGKIKTKKALQLGLGKMKLSQDDRGIDSFKANITEGYQLNGSFQAEADNQLSLTVSSIYLPDGIESQTKEHYNCAMVKK